MRRKILASLIYAGRSREWLARRLGISERTLQRRLSNENEWTLLELRRMRELFKWETLEG